MGGMTQVVTELHFSSLTNVGYNIIIILVNITCISDRYLHFLRRNMVNIRIIEMNICFIICTLILSNQLEQTDLLQHRLRL